MALDTVASVLSSISGDSDLLNDIRDRAIATSAIARLKAPTTLTQPVVRGLSSSRITGVAAAEGATKTTTSGILTAYSYQTLPVAIIVPVSNVLYQSSADLQKFVIATLTEAISVGIDNEILRDPNSTFGKSLVASATSAGNTTTTGAYLYNDMSTAFDQVQSTYYTVNGVIGRRAELGALRLAVPSGQTMFNPMFTPAHQNMPADIFGAQCEFVDTRALPKTAATAETRFVVGDFSQLEWGTFGGMQIKVSQDAATSSWNAFTQNLVLVRAEMYIGFTIVNDAAFAIIKEV